MNYKKIYDDLINKFKNFENKENLFLERHHIIPRCLGGKDKNNTIMLPTRYHFVSHLLLWKMYPKGTEEHNKMAFAVHRFKTNSGNKFYSRNIKINSKIYSKIQKENAEFCKKRMELETKEERKKYGSKGINNPMYGKKRPDFAEIVRKINISNKGTHIYNNGIINVRAKKCPDGFVKGSLVKGRKYYNNGKINVVSDVCPNGFVEGKIYVECHWYNNGKVNIKTKFCPQGFVKGKLHKPYKKREVL